MFSTVGAASGASALTDNPFIVIGVPILVAVLGIGGTVAVTVINSVSRSREVAAERAERDKRFEDERAEQHRLQMVDAVESIVVEIALYADEIIALQRKLLPSSVEGTFQFPSQAALRSGFARLTTRARNPDLFMAFQTALNASRKVPLPKYLMVLGVMQERLDLWFVGTRTTEETIEALRSDATVYASGEIPEAEDDLPPGVGGDE